MKILRKIFLRHQEDNFIPVNNLRCQVKPFSELQGFSGRQIEYFPPYDFFKLSISNRNDAFKDFSAWMNHCLLELGACKVPKSEGGWAKGSLHKLIIKLHLKKGIELQSIDYADAIIISEAIDVRVNYYLDLFQYIKISVQNNRIIEPVICYPQNEQGLYFLYDGHHRASALKALGVFNIRTNFLQNIGSK